MLIGLRHACLFLYPRLVEAIIQWNDRGAKICSAITCLDKPWQVWLWSPRGSRIDRAQDDGIFRSSWQLMMRNSKRSSTRESLRFYRATERSIRDGRWSPRWFMLWTTLKPQTIDRVDDRANQEDSTRWCMSILPQLDFLETAFPSHRKRLVASEHRDSQKFKETSRDRERERERRKKWFTPHSLVFSAKDVVLVFANRARWSLLSAIVRILRVQSFGRFYGRRFPKSVLPLID